jgi:hypothetical protein
MIVGSFENLDSEIGYYGVANITDSATDWHRMPTRIIRKATIEEYLEQCKQHNCLDLIKQDISNVFFYEIQVD